MPTLNVSVTYRPAPGASFGKKDAAVIGRRLEELEQEAGGSGVTPTAVVDDARSATSPLHRYFTWDDAEAAQAHRLWQARSLLNHLVVVVKDGGREVETKGWHSVRITPAGEEEAERSYASVATVAVSEELREQVVANALRELNYWTLRYSQYQELQALVRAINKAKRQTPVQYSEAGH